MGCRVRATDRAADSISFENIDGADGSFMHSQARAFIFFAHRSDLCGKFSDAKLCDSKNESIFEML